MRKSKPLWDTYRFPGHEPESVVRQCLPARLPSLSIMLLAQSDKCQRLGDGVPNRHRSTQKPDEPENAFQFTHSPGRRPHRHNPAHTVRPAHSPRSGSCQPKGGCTHNAAQSHPLSPSVRPGSWRFLYQNDPGSSPLHEYLSSHPLITPQVPSRVPSGCNIPLSKARASSCSRRHQIWLLPVKTPRSP
jgi:hypothetical protein